MHIDQAACGVHVILRAAAAHGDGAEADPMCWTGHVPSRDPDWIRRQLDAALRRLTWSAPEQADWLAHQTVPLSSCDELAVQYGDMVVLTGHLPQLSTATVERLKAVNELLDEMSGPENASLWTLDALRQGAVWDRVRKLASEALASWEADWSPRN